MSRTLGKFSKIYIILFKFIVMILISTMAFSFSINDDSPINDPLGPLAKFKKNMASLGITYELSSEHIEITINQLKTLNALPDWICKGIISRPDSQAINTFPLSIIITLAGISSSINIVNSTFQRDHSLNTLYVQGYVIPTGTSKKIPCYSFHYTRNDFNKLDLSIITPQQFVKITPNFTWSKWCKNNMEIESINLSKKYQKIKK